MSQVALAHVEQRLPRHRRKADPLLVRHKPEATQRLTDEEKTTVKRVLEGLLLAHEAKRWAA